MKHIAVDVTPLVKQVEGMSYLPWADVLTICQPDQHVVLHPAAGVLHPVFGGGLVAIDQAISGSLVQRTWLTVMNMKGGPIPFASITSRDAGDTINRCRARSATVVDGVGIGLYLDEPNGAKLLKRLGLNESTADLSQINPIIKGKVGKEYVPWAAALAAARVTDPSFCWSVVEFETVNEHGEICSAPYTRVPSGYLVAVDLSWKGKKHREFLPIMGVMPVQTKKGIKNLDHQSLLEPDACDWHNSTMRALAKGIALLTGYGRSAYAEDLAVPVESGAGNSLICEIEDLIAETSSNRELMLKHFSVPSLEATPQQTAERMIAALRKKRDGATPLPVSHQPEPQAEGVAAPAENSALWARIEFLAVEKRVPGPMLLSFFRGRPLKEASTAELKRAITALERMTPAPLETEA